MKVERLTRFAKGANESSRRYFGQSFMQALDRLGVEPGQDFVIANVHEQPELESGGRAPESIGANAEGAARTADTATAKAAAVNVFPRSGTQRSAVFVAVLSAGNYGLTAHEVAEKTGIEYRSVTPRIGELKNGQWVTANGTTRPTPMQAEAEVLIATQKGIKEAKV